MSEARKWLESRGWRLFSRRKHGMYIKERWYHPRDGSVTMNQGDAVRSERLHAQSRPLQAIPSETKVIFGRLLDVEMDRESI